MKKSEKFEAVNLIGLAIEGIHTAEELTRMHPGRYYEQHEDHPVVSLLDNAVKLLQAAEGIIVESR